MLTLSIGSHNATLSTYLSSECPRIKVQSGSVEYTAGGGSVGRGGVFEPYHSWAIDCLINELDAKRIRILYYESEYRRRHPNPAELPEITIWDQSFPFEERAPRTRPIVPDTEEELIGDYVFYSAQFKARFTAEPRISKGYQLPGLYRVQIALTEVR